MIFKRYEIQKKIDIFKLYDKKKKDENDIYFLSINKNVCPPDEELIYYKKYSIQLIEKLDKTRERHVWRQKYITNFTFKLNAATEYVYWGGNNGLEVEIDGVKYDI